MPPTYSQGVLDYVDLDIDILVWPNGRCDVLDLDDFENNARVFGYPDDLIRKVELELQTLLTMIRRDELPRLDP
jgi:protein associated with RNAse G/E